VRFRPSEILGCIRADLTTPDDGERFASGEVNRRIYRAVVGIDASMVLQLAVSTRTPAISLTIPAGVRVQIVAPDVRTLRMWLDALSEATR
jgi:hypothetical protein